MTIRRHKDGGPLHDLLLRACPPNEKGEKSITILAEKMGISAWSIHKWVKKGKIPPNRVKEIVELAPSEVSLADFTAFVYV